jgi:hypothetical protein
VRISGTQLLNVLGGGDSSRVEELIVPPAPGRDGLEMTPTIQDFLVNANSSSDIMVHDQSDLNSLVHDAAGLRFELSGTHHWRVRAKGFRPDPELGQAPR